MSYTTILAIYSGDKIEGSFELSNSYGSAPVIWDIMCQKYLGYEPMRYMSKLDNLWPLWKDTNIPEHHRAVLMMTFDKAYISKENYLRAANDIRTTLKELPYNSEYVNHWPKIADYLESNPEVPAIGIWHTSVSDNPYVERWNDEEERYEINWQDLYEIYAELSKLKHAKYAVGNDNVE